MENIEDKYLKLIRRKFLKWYIRFLKKDNRIKISYFFKDGTQTTTKVRVVPGEVNKSILIYFHKNSEALQALLSRKAKIYLKQKPNLLFFLNMRKKMFLILSDIRMQVTDESREKATKRFIDAGIILPKNKADYVFVEITMDFMAYTRENLIFEPTFSMAH